MLADVCMVDVQPCFLHACAVLPSLWWLRDQLLTWTLAKASVTSLMSRKTFAAIRY